jgi:hypothetical protein
VGGHAGGGAYWTRADFHWWAARLGFEIDVEAPYEGTPGLKTLWPGLFAAAMVYVLKRVSNQRRECWRWQHRVVISLGFQSFCMGDLSYVDIQEYLKHSDTILIPKASLSSTVRTCRCTATPSPRRKSPAHR